MAGQTAVVLVFHGVSGRCQVRDAKLGSITILVGFVGWYPSGSKLTLPGSFFNDVERVSDGVQHTTVRAGVMVTENNNSFTRRPLSVKNDVFDDMHPMRTVGYIYLLLHYK